MSDRDQMYRTSTLIPARDSDGTVLIQLQDKDPTYKKIYIVSTQCLQVEIMSLLHLGLSIQKFQVWSIAPHRADMLRIRNLNIFVY